MPRSLRAGGVGASDFSLGKCAPGGAAVCARVQNPPAPGPFGRSKRMACANEGSRALGHAARLRFPGFVASWLLRPGADLSSARRAMGTRALKAAKAPIAQEIGRRCGGSPTRLVGRAPRPDRRLLSPHWPKARAPLRRGRRQATGRSETISARRNGPVPHGRRIV